MSRPLVKGRMHEGDIRRIEASLDSHPNQPQAELIGHLIDEIRSLHTVEEALLKVANQYFDTGVLEAWSANELLEALERRRSIPDADRIRDALWKLAEVQAGVRV